jgi:DNA-binding beta-propeller fold protein YncE
MEVIAVYDEKIVITGISQGKLCMFIMELLGQDYSINKALYLGASDSFAIHSIEFFDNAVYMADSYNNKIYKLDSTNNFFETNVGRDPRHMCSDKENVYVANFESDNISIIELNTFTLTGSIPAGIKAHDVIYAERNKTLYTSCYEENEVVEYSIDKGTSRRFKTEGKPMHIYVLEDIIIVMTYFVNGNVQTKINFINLINKNIEDTLKIDGLASDFLLDYDNNMLYILNIVDKSLYFADAVSRSIIKKVYLGGYPESISCGSKKIYVTNSKKQQIDIIEKKEHSLSSLKLQITPGLIKVIP